MNMLFEIGCGEIYLVLKSMVEQYHVPWTWYAAQQVESKE